MELIFGRKEFYFASFGVSSVRTSAQFAQTGVWLCFRLCLVREENTVPAAVWQTSRYRSMAFILRVAAPQ